MGGFAGFTGDNNLCLNSEDNINIFEKMREKIKHRGGLAPGYVKNESGNLIIFSDVSSMLSPEEILRLYEEYGGEAASKIRGGFAFVIYNAETRSLYGARDCFGSKPFYYYLLPPSLRDTPLGEGGGNLFMFGSEIKSFLVHPDFKKEINKNILKLYMIFQYSPLDETFFKNVYKLPQGCYFNYDCKNHEFKITRYFDIEYKKEHKSYGEYINLLEKTLLESIEYHSKNAEDIGGFLSGGVDSSFIASAAKPSRTFSVGFAKNGFDETVYAKDLSVLLGLENHRKIISGDEFFEILPEVQEHSDEPHANLSSVPLYYLSKMASEHVKFALSGEGSDEFFAGYLTFGKSRFVKLYEKLPFRFRKFIRKTVEKLPDFRGKATLIQCGQKVEDYYIGQAFIIGDEEANNILSEDYKTDMSYKDVTRPYFEKVKDRSDLVKKLYLDMFLWMPSDILLKADKMSAAHGLEIRSPILDKEVFALASKIPEKYLTKNKITKRIFRDVANKYIPEEWAKRKKLGFPVPFSLWLREEKYYDTVKNMFREDFVSGFFIREKILAMLEEHFEGKRNNGRKIYTIYSFLVWYKVYFRDMREGIFINDEE